MLILLRTRYECSAPYRGGAAANRWGPPTPTTTGKSPLNHCCLYQMTPQKIKITTRRPRYSKILASPLAPWLHSASDQKVGTWQGRWLLASSFHASWEKLDLEVFSKLYLVMRMQPLSFKCVFNSTIISPLNEKRA